MAVIGELAVNVVARTSGLTSGMNRARKQMGVLSSAALGVRRSLLALGAAFTAFEGIKAMVRLAAETEQVITQFEVMTGSLEVAKGLYTEMRDLAAGTPLQLDSLLGNSRTLMLFGESADTVTETLRMLGDVSGGNQTNLKFMVRAFGQISSLGRLQAQDLMQLVNAGWNPLEQIMKKTGETMAEVRDRMKDGKVSADEVKEALEKATGPGGRFNGMMEKMSKTFSGRWSTLIDNIKQLGIQFGEILLPVVEKAVTYLSGLVQWFKGLSVETKKLIATGIFSMFTSWLAGKGFEKLLGMTGLGGLTDTLGKGATKANILVAAITKVAGIFARITGGILGASAFAKLMKESADSSQQIIENTLAYEQTIRNIQRQREKEHAVQIRSFSAPRQSKFTPTPWKDADNLMMSANIKNIEAITAQEAQKRRMEETRNQVLKQIHEENKDMKLSLRFIASKTKRKDLEQAAPF
jgi:tape measure domain-containing protein